MYRRLFLLGMAITIMIVKYSAAEMGDKEDVRVPFGPQMCVEWCQTLGRCHSPIFDTSALSCRLAKTTFERRENSTDIYQLSTKKRVITDCNVPKRIIRTRKSTSVWVLDLVNSRRLPAMVVYDGIDLYQYYQEEKFWLTKPCGEFLFHLTAYATSNRIYCLFSWRLHTRIGYFELNNLKEETVLLRRNDQGLGTPTIAVDEAAGLIFYLSNKLIKGEEKCALVVYKDAEVILDVIMNIKIYEHVAINRKDEKLYIPSSEGSRRYVVEADYEGQTGRKVELPVEAFVRCTIYDYRDDVVFVLAGTLTYVVYRINFKTGLREEEKFSIPITPDLILVTCNTFVLLARDRGLVFDRNNLQGPVTEIDGIYGQRGVIFEHV